MESLKRKQTRYCKYSPFIYICDYRTREDQLEVLILEASDRAQMHQYFFDQ